MLSWRRLLETERERERDNKKHIVESTTLTTKGEQRSIQRDDYMRKRKWKTLRGTPHMNK